MYTTSCTLSYFLNNHRHYKDNSKKSYTNTRMPNNNKGSGGCFRIPQNKYEKFIKLYSEDLDNCKCGNKRLTEKFNTTAAPLVVDLDLRFDGRPNKSVFNKILIKELVNKHLNYLSQHFKHSLLHCVVLTCADNPLLDPKSGKYKDGLHLQFPRLILDRAYATLMRLDLMEPIHKLLQKTGNINSIQNTYDSVMTGRAPWMMYGSNKPGRQPYCITSIYRFNKQLELKNVTKAFNKEYSTTFDKVKLLSVRLERPAVTFKNNLIKKQLLAKYSKMICEIKDKSQAKRQQLFLDSNQDPLEPNTYIVGMEDYEVREIVELLECLKPERATNYDLWIYVGLALHNINPELFPIFDQFSQTAGNAYGGIDVCRDKWDSFNNHPGKGTLSLGSLRNWCKEDNFDKYSKLRHTFDMILELSRNGPTHYAIGKLLYSMYGRRLRCSIDESKKKTWYIFLNGLWCKRTPDFHLRSFMSEQVYHRCSEVASIIRKTDIDEDTNPLDKKLSDLMSKLQSNSYKNSVIKECETIFREWKFQAILDQNRHLLAFNNGVYDTKKHIFRPGLPDDFISNCCPISYDPTAVDNKLNEFINQILPDPELRIFVLKLLALSLTGIFIERLFIWIGVGANGKTSLMNLLHRVLGSDYMTSVKPHLLTRSNYNIEGPSPSFAKTRGKRCVYSEEIDRGESVNIGQFKYVISSGIKSARFLNENEFDFYPFYTFFLLVNHTPHIDATDPATWRRLLCVPFLAKFLDNPDPNEKYQFKIDREIEEKYYDQWAPPFVNILFHHLRLYQKEGLKVPTIVQKCTNEYRDKCDYINAFTRQYLIKTGNRKEIVTVPKIYEKFCEWYRKYKKLQVPDPTEMRHLLESNYFKQEAVELEDGELGWRGYKIKDPNSFKSECDDEF